MGFNCFKARATWRRQFTFTTKFPEIPGTPTFKKMWDLNVFLQKVKESLGRWWRVGTESVSEREVIKYFHISLEIPYLSKVVSQVMCQNALGQSDCRIL